MTINKAFLYEHLDQVNALLEQLPALLAEHQDELKAKRPDQVFEIVFATNTDDVAFRTRNADQPTAKDMGGELVVELLDPATKQPNIEIYGAFMGGL